MKCDVYLWQLARRIPKTQEAQNGGREMLPKFSVTLLAVSPAVSAILIQWENIFKSKIFAVTFLVLRQMNTRDSGTPKLSATSVIKVRVEKRNICQGILGCFLFCGRQSKYTKCDPYPWQVIHTGKNQPVATVFLGTDCSITLATQVCIEENGAAEFVDCASGQEQCTSGARPDRSAQGATPNEERECRHTP
jgi:hypothetical protein